MLMRVPLAVACVCALSSYAAADPTNPNGPDADGNVTWGSPPFGSSVTDAVPPRRNERNSRINFNWTADGHINPDYGGYTESNSQPTSKIRHFVLPGPSLFGEAITDWQQDIGYDDLQGHFHSSRVQAGNIGDPGRAWAFFPLYQLPDTLGRIPDFGPSGDNNEPNDLTIYAAVNLRLYLSTNPNGFSNGNWLVGQTLNQTGVQIVNGQIAGLQGIYFSSTPFTFDAGSATGWVPADGTGWLNSADWQAAHGDIEILGEHVVPAPGSVACLVSAALFASRRRRRD